MNVLFGVFLTSSFFNINWPTYEVVPCLTCPIEVVVWYSITTNPLVRTMLEWSFKGKTQRTNQSTSHHSKNNRWPDNKTRAFTREPYPRAIHSNAMQQQVQWRYISSQTLIHWLKTIKTGVFLFTRKIYTHVCGVQTIRTFTDCDQRTPIVTKSTP